MYIRLFQKAAPVVITHPAEIQTELHPIPTKIDPEYMWNVWDLKRQALLLVYVNTAFVSTVTLYFVGKFIKV